MFDPLGLCVTQNSPNPRGVLHLLHHSSIYRDLWMIVVCLPSPILKTQDNAILHFVLLRRVPVMDHL